MINLQKTYKEIRRGVNLLLQIDVNDSRESAIQTVSDLIENATKLKQELEAKEGKFKAVTQCLECREDGLAYEVDNFKKQIVKCEFCKCNLSVKLYKSGRVVVSRIERG